MGQDIQSIVPRLITLDEAFKLAMANNLEIKMAQKDSAIASKNLLNAKTARTPHIGAGIHYNYIGNPVLYQDFYTNDSSIDYYNHQAGWNVVARIPIYSGGAIQTRIEQEKMLSRIQNEILNMTQAQIKLVVITQFHNLYKLYREVEILEENIRNVKINIRQLNSKVSNGQNLISDLTRTELQLSNFEIQVFNIWNNIDLLSNYLCIFTGIPTSTRLQPSEVIVQLPADTFVYEQCLEEALANRYELKQAEYQKTYSELSLKLTKSAFYPDITGSAIFNSEHPVPGTFPPQPDILNYWAVGIGLSYNLSSFYRINHRIQADKIQIEKLEFQVDNVRNSIDQEVKVAYVLFLESKKNIQSYMKNVELAQLNHKIVKSKYDNEFALIIDMIDAELQLNEAKISLNNAVIDAINQYYNLLYAIGRLN